jgi:hypothetical protein
MPGIMHPRIKQHYLQEAWDVGIGQSHPVRPTERITSEIPCWATTTPVQDSAESKATRHIDSPTDRGLEYLFQATPSGHASTTFQFQAHSLSYGTFAMDVSDSSAKYWLDIAQTMDVQQDFSSHSQDETVKSDMAIEDPVCLFGQFVSAVTSNTLKDIQSRSEVS